MIKNFRNLLALVVIILIMAMWVVQGLGFLNLPGEVLGASIAGWMLLIQFYFRKKQDNELVS